MSISWRALAVLAALALCIPGTAFGQASTTGEGGSGVSTQPPVPLKGGERTTTSPSATTTTPSTTATTPAATTPPPVAPPASTTDQKTSRAGGELPNTGSDPRLLLLVGVALTLLGVGLRLRTADAELY